MASVSITLLLTAIIVLGGSMVSAMAGFGFGIVTMPFLLLLYPPKTAVALSLCISTAGLVLNWISLRKLADYRVVGLLLLGAVLGLPLGGYVLVIIDANLLRALIGLAVLAATIMAFRTRGSIDLPPRRAPAQITLATGLSAGLLSTTTNQPGIPVAFLLAWSRLDKSVVRATFTAFFAALHFGSITTLYAGGILTTDIGLTGASLAPVYLIGWHLGNVGFRRSGPGTYRTLMLTVLSISAVLGVFNGVRGLL